LVVIELPACADGVGEQFCVRARYTCRGHMN
jgi:hypothetical protein